MPFRSELSCAGPGVGKLLSLRRQSDSGNFLLDFSASRLYILAQHFLTAPRKSRILSVIFQAQGSFRSPLLLLIRLDETGELCGGWNGGYLALSSSSDYGCHLRCQRRVVVLNARLQEPGDGFFVSGSDFPPQHEFAINPEGTPAWPRNKACHHLLWTRGMRECAGARAS